MTEQLIDGPFYAQTHLPTEYGDFDVRVYRHQGKEHLLISVGDLDGAKRLPVRVHSECLTGEVLGSLKCDCKPQLLAALAYIAERGRGAVAYLRQEGRGIGLGNKIRAYRLQEDGYDTVDANRELGFGDDLRQYDMAAEMIAAAGIESVELMTNNPLKIEGLKAEGIPVVGRIEISVGENSVNTDYLETKRVRMGHMLDEDRPVTRIKRTQKPRLALA
ncbi:MAG: GTP cyclohydrolase II [Myxococcota bacterium]|nr:GTP cyclohydrolase II [Myxococcota bacterium]